MAKIAAPKKWGKTQRQFGPAANLQHRGAKMLYGDQKSQPAKFFGGQRKFERPK